MATKFGTKWAITRPLKRKLHAVCTYPLFSGLRYPIVHLNYSPANPRCHGNEFWDKIHYNSVCVRNICKIFASIVGFSGMGHRMLPTEFFPKRPSLPWQRNLGHNGLELSLRKRYIENLCIRLFSRSVYFGMGSAQLFKSAHMHPAKILYRSIFGRKFQSVLGRNF